MQFYLYQAADGWRWHLKSDNGRIIADSGEAYAERSDAEHGIELVKTSADVSVTLVPTGQTPSHRDAGEVVG